MGDTGGDSLILMIAEFSPGKRHKDIIEALALTKDPSIRLAFAGKGPRLEEIRELAASKGLADRVSFLGFREDIPLLISAADATALPSEREGLPRSVMESMALGTPVIGADVRGVRDMLADGRGTLVPLGDVVKLAEALKKHKTATPETEAIIKKAKERAENYDVQKIIKLHEEIYDEVTGRLINRTKN